MKYVHEVRSFIIWQPLLKYAADTVCNSFQSAVSTTFNPHFKSKQEHLWKRLKEEII